MLKECRPAKTACGQQKGANERSLRERTEGSLAKAIDPDSERFELSGAAAAIIQILGARTFGANNPPDAVESRVHNG